jgi:hypothetical protein
MLSLHCRATLVAPYPDEESQIEKIMCKIVRQEKNPSRQAHHWTVVRVDTHRHTRPLTSWHHFAVIDSVEDYCCIASHSYTVYSICAHCCCKYSFLLRRKAAMLYPLCRKLSEGYFARRIVRVRSSDEGDQRFNFLNYKIS